MQCWVCYVDLFLFLTSHDCNILSLRLDIKSSVQTVIDYSSSLMPFKCSSNQQLGKAHAFLN